MSCICISQLYLSFTLSTRRTSISATAYPWNSSTKWLITPVLWTWDYLWGISDETVTFQKVRALFPFSPTMWRQFLHFLRQPLLDIAKSYQNPGATYKIIYFFISVIGNIASTAFVGMAYTWQYHLKIFGICSPITPLMAKTLAPRVNGRFDTIIAPNRYKLRGQWTHIK